VQIFPNAQLGGDQAMFSQVRTGAIQIYSGYGGLFSTVAPLAGIEAVGFAFKSQEQALKAMDGLLGKAIRADIDSKAGVVTMNRACVNGFREITTSTKPIQSVDDLSGLKIRTPTAPIWLDMFKALGASPTPINANEMYTALQTHIVDGQENPLVIEMTFRLYEVQKYLSLTNHMWSNFWTVVNADTFKSLSPDQQKLLRSTMDRYALENRAQTEALNNSLSDKLSRLGLKINSVDPAAFRAKLAASGFYTKYKAQYGDANWALLEASAGKLG
jgi:tripartite ATP-independent transporter DctP family solute receptor